MSYFVSKIGHFDPRFYSLIYCAIPGVQMSGVHMSGVQMSGVQMSGVQMSDSQLVSVISQFMCLNNVPYLSQNISLSFLIAS